MRLLLLSAFLLSGTVTAQSLPDWAAPSAAAPPSEMEAMPPPPPPPPPPVPVDGGLLLLAIAGTGFAARRLRSAS